LWYLLYRNPSRPVGPYGGLPVEWVSKYVAMIVLALEHMHRHGIAYRDLKPENLLLNRTGHIKLVDFGFCKHIPFLSKSGVSQYRTYTLCGTPDYIAPEVILTQGHDKSVDYWSLGIMVYEMLSRRTPFSARSQRIMFERIVHSNKFLRFPQPFDAHAKSLVRRMLHPNPALRFGNGNDGIDSIKKHAFFSINDVNWTDVENLTFEVPYVPEAVEPQINLEPLDLESEADINIDDLDEQDPTFANIILSPLSVHDYDDLDDD
jgi:serine/threonine protein kinase